MDVGTEVSAEAVTEPHHLDASEHAAGRLDRFDPETTRVGPVVAPRADSLEPVIVITRPDGETLRIAVEYGGQAGEDITTATHDEHGAAGMGQVADVAKALGEALGVRWEER